MRTPWEALHEAIPLGDIRVMDTGCMYAHGDESHYDVNATKIIRNASWEDLPLLALRALPATAGTCTHRNCSECTAASLARFLLEEHHP